MRGGILAAGIFLLVFGLFLYFTGNNMMKEVEAYDVEGLPISEILKLVSPDAREHYERGQSMVMYGSIFSIIGFILCIAGIAAPSKKPQVIAHQPSHPPVIVQQTSSKEGTKSDRRCPECGRAIPEDTKLCPYCGKKFKLHFEEEKVKTKKQLKEKTKPPKHCSDCGYKFEEEDLIFCPKCGIKLK